MDFRHRNVVVTGADSSTGRRIAVELAKLGTNLAIVGSDAAKISAVVKEIQSFGGQAFAVCTEGYQLRKTSKAYLSILSVFSHIDFVVNGLGIQDHSSLLKDWHEVKKVSPSFQTLSFQVERFPSQLQDYVLGR